MLIACKTTLPLGTSTGSSAGSSAGVVQARRNLAVIKATEVEVTKKLTETNNHLISLPQDSPLTREISRQLAILQKQVGDMGLQVAKAEVALETALAKELEIPLHKVEAEKGDAISQFTLGWAYAIIALEYKRLGYANDDDGIKNNYQESLKWYRKAAEEQNHAKSQFNLGMMYYNGTGVLKDPIFVYAWWKVAESNGYADARVNLDFISNSMSREQIATAQKLSKQILADIEQKKPTNPPCY